jgi:hypothetical protein
MWQTMFAWARTRRGARVLAWWALLAASVGITAILDQLGQGVVLHLELAGTAERFQGLLDARPGLDLGDLRTAQWVDFLYLISYAVLLWTGCRWAAGIPLAPAMRRLGRPLAIGAVAAACLDVIENVGLLANLDGPVQDRWALVATTASWPKWVLALAATAYVFTAGLVRIARFLYRRHPTFAPGVPGPSGGPAPSWLGSGAWDPKPGKRGVCFSGGGIRSASYALGALQALSSAGVMRGTAHVSAVSGGAYLAGAWAIAERHRVDGGHDPQPWSRGSPEEGWLRNHTSYLIDGPAQAVRAGLRFAAGLAVNVAVLYVGLFLLARPVGWALSSWAVAPGLRGDPTPDVTIPSYLWLPGLATAVFTIAFAAVAVNIRGWRRGARYESAAIGAGALALALITGLVAAPVAVELAPRALANGLSWLLEFNAASDTEAPRRTVNAVWLLESLGLLTVIAAALRAMFARARGPLVSIATRLVVPAMAVLAAIYLLAGAALHGPRGRFSIFDRDIGPEWAVWVVVLATYIAFFLVSDLVTWSLHPYYKSRLRSAFALKRTAADTVVPLDQDEERTLDAYPSGVGPQLVVCAAANLSDRGITPPGRPVRPFTFSSTEVGDCDLGWVHPRDFATVLGRRRREDATVSTAVAVSGAAFSPAMGKMGTHRPLALLALVNARLGVWYPNPRTVTALKMGAPSVPWYVRTRFDHLFRELFGWYGQASRLVYVTDGGHVENLGLVELLRRGCTEVWCFDASGDKGDTFRTLAEAIAFARMELGIEIDIDPTPIAPNADTPRRAPVDAVVGRIRYGQGVPDGVLYYAKTAVTPHAPWDVQAFADHDPRFPWHSTGDQLFDHEQFEAYRALGEFTAERLAVGRALLALLGVDPATRIAATTS